MARPVPVQFQQHNTQIAIENRKARTGEWVWNGKCSTKCSMNPAQLGPHTAFAEQLFKDGDHDREIANKLRMAGYACSPSGVARHRQVHLDKAGYSDHFAQTERQRRSGTMIPVPEGPELEPVDNIVALRRIIAVGMQKLPASKISAELVVKAIDLEERLTRGTKTNALMEALASAFDDEVPEDEEFLSPIDAAAMLSEQPDV